MIKILFLLMFLLSCGKQIEIKEEINLRTFEMIDPRFNKYVEKFENTCKTKVENLPIQFGTANDFKGLNNNLGYCQFFIGEKIRRQIKIRYSWWSSAPEHLREWLIYHELGHCHFYLGHDDRILASGYPLNIMHSIMPIFIEEDKIDFYLESLCLMGGSIKEISNKKDSYENK